MVYAFLALGFVLLLVGSEAVFRGGAGFCRAVGLPPLFIGLVAASLAMAGPELAVALQASSRGMSDIAVGDVVGSSIANILLVFGLGALMMPMPCPPRTVFRDGGVLIGAALVLVFLSFGAFIAKPLGGMLVAGWVGYLVLAYLTDWGRATSLFGGNGDVRMREYGGPLSIFLLAIGVICLYFGARLAIDFAILIARNLHVSQIAVALTVIAFGTSLPELARTIGASSRGGAAGLSSKLVASSIFNLLLVLGIAALIRPISVAPMIASVDAPVLAVCAVFLAVLMLFGWRLSRLHGVLLLLGYAGYIVSVGLRAGFHLPH